MTLQPFITRVNNNEHLSFDDMLQAAKLVFNETTPKDEIAQFLVALSQKGETAEEIAALATVMKANSLNVAVPEGVYMDNCGTGGDGLKSFNISTASAFILSSCGIKVAKHGNRKISSSSGSADVLDALGIPASLSIDQSVNLIKQHGITFLFAPSVHPKLKRLGEIRRAIGKPTIFNLVGPLTNPVNIERQLVGINRPALVMQYAEVLKLLGRKRAIVVSGSKGMDEASLNNENTFALLHDGEVIPFSIDITQLGFSETPVEDLRGGTPEENAEILRNLLKGKRSPYYNAVLLNAAIALFAYGKVENVKDGVEMAREAIHSGKAYEKLEAVSNFCQSISKENVAL